MNAVVFVDFLRRIKDENPKQAVRREQLYTHVINEGLSPTASQLIIINETHGLHTDCDWRHNKLKKSQDQHRVK